jgi:hypothetical protein
VTIADLKAVLERAATDPDEKVRERLAIEAVMCLHGQFMVEKTIADGTAMTDKVTLRMG